LLTFNKDDVASAAARCYSLLLDVVVVFVISIMNIHEIISFYIFFALRGFTIRQQLVAARVDGRNSLLWNNKNSEIILAN